MFKYIYNQIENHILDLIYKVVDSKIERIENGIGQPERDVSLWLFSSQTYRAPATGLYKEIQQIRDYLNVELVKKEASEQLVAKKNK